MRNAVAGVVKLRRMILKRIALDPELTPMFDDAS